MKIGANFIVEKGHRCLVAFSVRNKNRVLYLKQLPATALIEISFCPYFARVFIFYLHMLANDTLNDEL